MIGRRPHAAFGNSTGGRQMLEYAAAGDGARLMMLVLHDDAAREYAYGPARGLPDTKVGTFTQALYEPLLADLAHSNRIADGLARSSHVVQPPLFRSDDDGARRDRFLHRHHVAATVRRFDSRQTGSAEGRCQEYKQSLFHSLTLNCYKQKCSG